MGIKIAGRNIRYAYDMTLMTESEEELRSLLMKVKEESKKAGLKLNIRKTKIMASSPIIAWQIDGEILEKEYVKAVYCHPAYLTYMESTSCECQTG